MDKETENVRIHMDLWTQRLSRYHESLWEEEKHYTWWIYIVFGVLVLVYGNKDIFYVWKLLIIAGGATFGVFMSLVGFAVVRREGIEWYTAYEIVKRSILYLGLFDVEFETMGRKLRLMPEQEPLNFATFKVAGKTRENANKRLRDLFVGLLFNVYNGLPKTRSLREWMRKELSHKIKRVNLGIRDYFQITFIASAALFAIFLLFSILTINPDP
jgi:hypothetical protein